MILFFSFFFRNIYIETENEKNVTLQSLSISSNVVGSVSQSSYELKYFNGEADSIASSILYLPFDRSSAISDVFMITNNTLYLSRALENGKASIEFNESIEKSQTSLLVKQEDNWFSIHLAVIPPRENITIHFKVSSLMETKRNTRLNSFYNQFIIPLTMVTPYTPAHLTNPSIPPLSPHSVPYDFAFHFSAPYSERIESFLKNDAKIDHLTKTISYSGPLENDISIDIYRSLNDQPKIELFNGTQITSFSFNGNDFYDPNKKEIAPKSFVILLDRSGSMMGESIENAGKALNILIHSLPKDCFFNIIGFGSNYHQMFPELIPYTDANLKEAMKLLPSMAQADLGGTEIYQPMAHILKVLKPEVCFLITDGAVSNSEQIINLSKEYNTKIFSLGIGNNAAVDLLRSLAQSTNSNYEMISDSKQISLAVYHLLEESLYDSWNKISIESDCGKLFSNELKTIRKNTLNELIYYSENLKNKCYVNITCYKSSNNETISKSFNIDNAERREDKVLHEIAVVSAANNNCINENETVSFAEKLNLLTRYTSLLLFNNNTKVNTSMKSNKETIPIFDRHAHFDSFSSFSGVFFKAKGGMPQQLQMHRSEKVENFVAEDLMDEGDGDPPNSAIPETSICEKLMNEQSVDGSFNNLDKIFDILKIKNKDISIQKYVALISVYMDNNCETFYQHIVSKSHEWLRANTKSEEDYQQVIDWARSEINKINL